MFPYTQGLGMPSSQPNNIQDLASLGLHQQRDDLGRLQAARTQITTTQQQNPPQQGINPQVLQHFMGGAEASAAGTAEASAGTGAATATTGSSALLNPWTALAAAALINEREAKRGGYRRDGTQYFKDLMTGKNIEQDVNQRWAPKIGGDNDKLGIGSTMRVGGELLTGDFTNAGRAFDDSTAAKLVKAPFQAIKKVF